MKIENMNYTQTAVKPDAAKNHFSCGAADIVGAAPTAAKGAGEAEKAPSDTVLIRSGKASGFYNAFKDFLNQLRSEHPEIRFAFQSDYGGACDIISAALGEMNEGYLILISEDFMGSLYNMNESDYARKAQALTDAVRRLGSQRAGAMVFIEENRAVYMARKSEQEKSKAAFTAASKPFGTGTLSGDMPSETKNALRKAGINAPGSYKTTGLYSRVAHAKSKAEVQSAMQEARRDISSLKLLSVYGDSKERLKAKKALQSLQKLLLRGQAKIHDFDNERLTDIRRKRAQQNEQKKKEMQAELELKKRRLTRTLRSGAIMKEGQLQNLEIPGYKNHNEEDRLKAMYGDFSTSCEAYTPDFTAAYAEGAIPLAGADSGGAFAENMQVSEIVPF